MYLCVYIITDDVVKKELNLKDWREQYEMKWKNEHYEQNEMKRIWSHMLTPFIKLLIWAGGGF